MYALKNIDCNQTYALKTINCNQTYALTNINCNQTNAQINGLGKLRSGKDLCQKALLDVQRKIIRKS